MLSNTIAFDIWSLCTVSDRFVTVSSRARLAEMATPPKSVCVGDSLVDLGGVEDGAFGLDNAAVAMLRLVLTGALPFVLTKPFYTHDGDPLRSNNDGTPFIDLEEGAISCIIDSSGCFTNIHWSVLIFLTVVFAAIISGVEIIRLITSLYGLIRRRGRPSWLYGRSLTGSELMLIFFQGVSVLWLFTEVIMIRSDIHPNGWFIVFMTMWGSIVFLKGKAFLDGSSP